VAGASCHLRRWEEDTCEVKPRVIEQGRCMDQLADHLLPRRLGARATHCVFVPGFQQPARFSPELAGWLAQHQATDLRACSLPVTPRTHACLHAPAGVRAPRGDAHPGSAAYICLPACRAQQLISSVSKPEPHITHLQVAS
jgi:hypothetical protein